MNEMHDETGPRDNKNRRDFLKLGALGMLAGAGSTLIGEYAWSADEVTSAGADEQLVADFSAMDHQGPMVMLNLLKFKPEGGFAGYMRYGALAQSHVAAAGAEVLFAGTGLFRLQGTQDWDAIVLVKFPARANFIAMVSNPEFAKISPIRTEALERAVLYSFAPMMLPAASAAPDPDSTSDQ